MASDKSDESEVEVAVAEQWYEEDIGFPVTDLILVVEGRKINVNKNVLSEHSPVFNNMLNGNFKESTAKEIVLEDKKATDVVEFLKCFYPNMNHPITEENVLQVLPLAHEYQSPLVEECENFMIRMCRPETGLTVNTLLDYILAGDKYDLTRFLKAAVEFCAHLDFHLLNGKIISENTYSRVNWMQFQETVQDKDILRKFSKIEMKTQLAIAKKRVQKLEMNVKKRKHSKPEMSDYSISLS